MLKMIRKRAGRRQLSDNLVAQLTAQARLPVFYAELGVADSVDGRFDLLVLHAWLVLDRLADQGERDLSQLLVDGLFAQFDEALRQQGAGDMGMGRRMTRMADAFYGRLKAYREAPDTEGLAAALLRNVYRGEGARVEDAKALAIYALGARARLATADLTAVEPDFGTPATHEP
jgi:cytochrome b pre-mRNA-processing protein 3